MGIPNTMRMLYKTFLLTEQKALIPSCRFENIRFLPTFALKLVTGPATGHLDTGFSWFPYVYKQMLRWFSRFQVASHVALPT